jgi:hypothetical protein
MPNEVAAYGYDPYQRFLEKEEYTVRFLYL